MLVSYSTLFYLLIPSTVSFTAYRRDDNTREVRRTEISDEVGERPTDFFLDDDPNGLDANEIYDSIMDANPEMTQRTDRRLFDSSNMVPVFRSEHAPTEIGFNAPPPDIPFTAPRGRQFQSIKSLKALRAPPPDSAPVAPLRAYPPLSAGFFGGIQQLLNLTQSTQKRSFFGAIEGAAPPPRSPLPPPAPLMVFTRPRELTPFGATEAPLPAPTRSKKLFWPVWKRNTIIWVRTPPPTGAPLFMRSNYSYSTTVRPLPPQPRPVFRPTPAPKPVHIQRNRGPTFNCRVLNPELDGRASVSNDWSCKMLFPGIPKDAACKCLYEVEARDDNGCATGYVYTCSRVH
ncbi:hypothetical protein PFISCL1PPCAC_23142 [Pristionchus fissidentatus]|uniref:Uncharacterized protein n=1 Tax=Pristionchus fissidentatus TaxID=1538716 RepID=A0AAV5WMS8_9BILA|nr:hypothetical protein PFISCL1PPCAC_23142 [Pristionchus fissidentatus]